MVLVIFVMLVIVLGGLGCSVNRGGHLQSKIPSSLLIWFLFGYLHLNLEINCTLMFDFLSTF